MLKSPDLNLSSVKERGFNHSVWSVADIIKESAGQLRAGLNDVEVSATAQATIEQHAPPTG